MIGPVWLLLAVVASTTPAVSVRGDSHCPTPAEVGAALAGLVGPPTAPLTDDVVDLIDQSTSVTVRLSSAAHELIGEKRLPESLSCAERARTAAVIVAAWEARWRGFAGPMAPFPPVVQPQVFAVAAAAGPAAARPPVAARPMAAAIASTAPGGGAVAPAGGATFRLETSAAVLASIVAGGVAPAATVEVTLLPRDASLALGVGVLAVGDHSMGVGDGRGRWRRFGGVVDLTSTSRWSAVELQLHAGVALTAVAISGESLPTTASATLFDPGALAGLRLRFPTRRLSPWIEATAASWPRTHALFVDGSVASAQLPPFEALLGLGLSFGRER